MADVPGPRCNHGRCIEVRGNDVNFCIQYKAICFMNVNKPKPRCDHSKCQAVRGRNLDHCILYELIKFHMRPDVVERHNRMHKLFPNPMSCNICVGVKILNRPMRRSYKHVSFVSQ